MKSQLMHLFESEVIFGLLYNGGVFTFFHSFGKRACPIMLMFLPLFLDLGDCQLQTTPCRIQKCTTDFVSLTSHLNSAIDGFDLEFCKALRAYSACTYRNSKVCRGNLVYHSAVLGINDLMSQRNCSKDGPTSSTNPEVTHDPCNYSGRQGTRELRGGEQTPPTYLFCALFGDPHLRTFKDHFQTCKVEGAWPLIDNNYLSVQVTNIPVVPGSSATATNKVCTVPCIYCCSYIIFKWETIVKVVS